MDPVCHCPLDRVENKLPKCLTCRGNANPRAALDKALLWLGEWMGRNFTERVPIIIDSGRGCQAWIRLADIPLNDKMKHGEISDVGVTRFTVRRANGYWLAQLDKKLGLCFGCKIDTSVSDLPRVMRCPGTVNIKTGKTATFIVASIEVFVGLSTLLVNGTPEPTFAIPDGPSGLAADITWQDAFPHLTKMAQDYLRFGQEEPGRHKVMWHTAKKLQEIGCYREEARKALRWANRLRGKEAKLPPDQVEHALDTAFGA
jgi:hypothetical protein